jgi:hypothetical protein
MMPHNAQCPQCAAPLPPGATRCGYCGFVTPWGATAAAVEQRAAFIQADQAKKQRIAKAESTARTGMILALVGLPICCAPLSLVGGALGFKGAGMARAEGQPRPVTSVIAMIVALLSTIAFVTTMVLYIRDQKAKDDRLAAVHARLKGKREAATIDAKVACDVVEEHLVQHGHGGRTVGLDRVHCDGALQVTDRRASLSDIRFSFDKANHTTVTACLERRARWYVLKLLDKGSCADLPPPAPFTAPARKLSEEEATADETKARAALLQESSALLVKAFTDRLAKVRANAHETPVAERVCSRSEMSPYVTGNERRKVATADYDLLNARFAGAAPSDWSFLTSEVVRKILDEKRTADERHKSLEELRASSGDLLVVYKAEVKDWPVVTSKSDLIGSDLSYKGGHFEGWLIVYDVATGERKCQSKLAFQSSDVVNFRKSRLSSGKKKAKEAVEEDFGDQFETAATAGIKVAAPDLRLGYKTIE